MGRRLAGDQGRTARRRIAVTSSRLPLQQQCAITRTDNGVAVYGTRHRITHASNANSADFGDWTASNHLTAVAGLIAFQYQMLGQSLRSRYVS